MRVDLPIQPPGQPTAFPQNSSYFFFQAGLSVSHISFESSYLPAAYCRQAWAGMLFEVKLVQFTGLSFCDCSLAMTVRSQIIKEKPASQSETKRAEKVIKSSLGEHVLRWHALAALCHTLPWDPRSVFRPPCLSTQSELPSLPHEYSFTFCVICR